MLWIAPVVENSDLMNALQRTSGCAPFLRAVFTLEIFHRVVFEPNARISSLLRAPMHQSFFADVAVARTRPASPRVRLAYSNTVLKPIQARVISVPQLLHLLKDILLSFG